MGNYYRVLGIHIEGRRGGHPLAYGPGQLGGEIINSKNDLLRHNPRIGPPKFERLTDAEVAELQAEEAEVSKEGDGLDGLTLDELRQIAAAEDPPIDLGSLTRKRDIIARIREAGAPASA